MCEDPNEAIQLPVSDRRALREAPRRRRPRHRALSRDPPASGRTTSRPSSPSKASRAARRIPSAPPRSSSPSTRASSDWPKLISVHEVQVKHATDPFTQVDLLHRIARLYEDALENHASAFDTLRARPLSRQRQRVDAPEPGTARDDREPVAARGLPLRRRARQAVREPRALRGARSPHRADLRGPARGRRQTPSCATGA